MQTRADRIARFAVGALLLCSSAAAAQDLATFYESEFRSFSIFMRGHLEKLQRCENEMNSFETENVFIEPVECPKFELDREQNLKPRLARIQPVLQAYRDKLAQGLDGSIDLTQFEGAAAEHKVLSDLVEVYAIRLEQIQIQTKRVRDIEGQLLEQFNAVFDAIGRESEEKSTGSQSK